MGPFGREKQQELRFGYFLLVTVHPDVVPVRKTVSYFSIFLQIEILTASTFFSFLDDALRRGAANLLELTPWRPPFPKQRYSSCDTTTLTFTLQFVTLFAQK